MGRTILVQEPAEQYSVPFRAQKKEFAAYTEAFTRMPNISSICGCCR